MHVQTGRERALLTCLLILSVPLCRFVQVFATAMVIAIITAIDGVITRLADIADNPAIDYKRFVIVSSWLQTAFEIWL